MRNDNRGLTHQDMSRRRCFVVLPEEHYRKWLDELVPAHGGRTPREAFTIKHLRRRLLSLVEGIENQATSSSRAPR